ncbi:MAG: hypothetical protein KDC61_10060 [Saprospiraceae bacterium]|nr:hypothetical protein [Saprospiraceae bacterium]MCB0574895.1 hypothetical protein [Saprospiraceae bacterium]MCB9306391.1 hypothetical protein [Lewinellaceae bacterium]MCB9353671.1 hypothetical protein [Lewinellaceae bacterium]
MNSSALITMVLANGVVLSITGYFFFKVLTTAPPDSVDEDQANYPRGG